MPRGNPTKLTPEMQAKIVPLIRDGLDIMVVAAKCGIHRDTIHEWLRRGESEESGIYSDFALVFREAEADFIIASLEPISKDPRGHRGLMWRLEKRFPRLFGTIKAEISGPNGGPLPVNIDAVALAQRIRQLAAGDAAADAGSGDAESDRGDDAGGTAGALAGG